MVSQTVWCPWPVAYCSTALQPRLRNLQSRHLFGCSMACLVSGLIRPVQCECAGGGRAGGRGRVLVINATTCVVWHDRTSAHRRVFLVACDVDSHLHRRVRLTLPRLHTAPTAQQRLPVCQHITTTFAFVSDGGYNYDSTSTRLLFDRATTIRRPTSRPGCCAAA